MAKLIIFNKPFDVLSQFTDADGRKTLSDFINIPNIYAAGRLDKNSEGLLILTDDGKLQQRIADPKFKWPKHYWVLVEGEVSDESLQILRKGVELKDGMTLPAKVSCIDKPQNLWKREPSIRYRKSIPTQWLDIVIKEGRNRQVRRMTAAVNHPTLRLIRHKIGPLDLDSLSLGQYKDIDISSLKI